jgi:hypothetical protein
MSITTPPTKLAEQLTAFLAYVTTPDHKPEPLKSSFAFVPANDNGVVSKIERLANEKLLKVTPSVEEILRNMKGDWTWGDPEFVVDPKTGEKTQLASTGPLKSIGDLKFSDGKQTEKAHMRGPDGDTIQYDRRMPRGAMLGTTESLIEDAGGTSVAITIGNGAFCERFGVDRHEYVPGGRRRRGRSYTADESKVLLAEAIANTTVLPEVKKLPPGMAAGTAQFSDQFIGMKIGSTGSSGAPSWIDIFMAGVDWEEDRRAHDEMSTQDKSVFAAAMEAQTLADISPGGSTFRARERGKRLLVAANDNYAANLRKLG